MKRISIILIFVSVSILTYAQFGTKRETFADKIFFGGSLGLSAGAVIQVDVSPIIGYRFTHRLAAGIGGTYQYYKDNRAAYNFETNIYGGRVFSSFIVVHDVNEVLPVTSNGLSLFLHAEVELLSLETRVFDVLHKYPGQDRFIVDSYLVGVGLKQKIGRRSAIELSFLWNLNDLDYSPYSNPVMRLGFSF